jgi:hypothetical protein
MEDNDMGNMNLMDHNSPQPMELARYLGYMHNMEGLSYITILVHKSAIATFCKPIIIVDISINVVVQHNMLQAISVMITENMKPIKPPVWDPGRVVDHLRKTTPVEYNLFETSRRTATYSAASRIGTKGS